MQTGSSGTGWEHFHHEADMGVRGFGPTPAEAFVQSALAMTAVIVDLDRVDPKESVSIACEEDDLEYLLNDWLNMLIFEMATRRMLFSRFEVMIGDNRLNGEAWGELVDVKKHQPAVEVKGATLTELLVQQTADGWIAQCVVDV